MTKIVFFQFFHFLGLLTKFLALLTDITTHETHYGVHKNHFKNVKIHIFGFIESFLPQNHEFCHKYHKNTPFWVLNHPKSLL